MAPISKDTKAALYLFPSTAVCSKLIFLSVTLNSLAFEHLFFAPSAPECHYLKLLLSTHLKLGRIFFDTVATMLKDVRVADPVTFLQCF